MMKDTVGRTYRFLSYAEKPMRSPRAPAGSSKLLKDDIMALYHLNASTGSREGGQSAAAKFDYIARCGNYSRQEDHLVHLVSGNLPAWAEGVPREYWRAADVYERANGRLFKQIEAALPIELDHDQRVALAELFAKKVAVVLGGGLPFTLALHEGRSKIGEVGNPHFHLVISERINDGFERTDSTWFKRAAVGKDKHAKDGGASKTDALKPKEWLISVRAMWSEMCNEALLKAGSSERVDHRSFVDRGVGRPAPVHLGPTACAFELRTGQISRRRSDAEALDRREKSEIDALQAQIQEKIKKAQELSDKAMNANRLLADIDRESAEETQWSQNGFDLSDLREFPNVVSGSEFYKIKRLESGAVLHLRMPVDRVAFVEYEHHIRMSKTDALSQESVSEAIKVACEKWGSITVTGSSEFKKLVFEKAADLGLSHLLTEGFAPPSAKTSRSPLRMRT
jgi:hypothetical protein